MDIPGPTLQAFHPTLLEAALPLRHRPQSLPTGPIILTFRLRISCGGRGASLCCWTARAEEPCAPSKACRWRDYEVHVDEGVDLACLYVREHEDKCYPPTGLIEDDCGPRRIVKSNDLLYDLIRCCDLTRIECLSWGAWHRNPKPVPWTEFVAMLEGPGADCGYGTRRMRFEVLFTGPVKSETVHPDCFSLEFTVRCCAQELSSSENRNWRKLVRLRCSE